MLFTKLGSWAIQPATPYLSHENSSFIFKTIIMLDILVHYFKKIPVKFRFLALVAMAFISALCFMNIGSAGADKHHLNGLLWAVGIVLGLVVIGIVAWGLNEMKRLDNSPKK
jgi:hypothetical protein